MNWRKIFVKLTGRLHISSLTRLGLAVALNITGNLGGCQLGGALKVNGRAPRYAVLPGGASLVDRLESFRLQ
jgi:hypothetical protein